MIFSNSERSPDLTADLATLFISSRRACLRASYSARSSSWSCSACSKRSRALAASRSNGLIASLSGGDFCIAGRPTITPHKFATTSQSSLHFGQIPNFRPMSDARATRTAQAT